MSLGLKPFVMATHGRNDPCVCGSGKKYKRCCLGREEQRDEFTRELQAHGLPLLRELGRFATGRSGMAPEAIAAERFPFWRPPLDRLRASRLLDYLIFDHRPASYGRSAAEEYLSDRGPIMTPRWRELLAAWQDVSMQLFAVEGWSAGFVRCRASLPPDGSLLEVMPLERADAIIPDEAPVALRPLAVGPGFVYPSWPLTFGDRTLQDVALALTARHHDFVRRERIVSMEEFLRLEGTAFDQEAAGGSPSPIILPGRSS